MRTRWNIAVLVIAIILTARVSEAAGATLSGKVVEAGTGLVVPGVTISAQGPKTATAFSASDGSFTLRNLIPGSYILITSLAGFETAQTESIPVIDGMEQTLTLTIDRNSYVATVSLGRNLSIPPPLLTYGGDIRAYYFGRTNRNNCLTCKTKGSPNATAFNAGGLLHGQLNIRYTPWTLGATYFGADPLGTNGPGPTSKIGSNPQIDNTLPGYALSLLGEAFVQYKTRGLFGQTGREIITSQESPWTNPSDSRMTPVAFQGTLLTGQLGPYVTLGGMYITRFRSRITSGFFANTLLTSCNTAFNTGKGSVPGVAGTFTVPGDPCNKPHDTRGFLQFSAQTTVGHLAAQAYRYQVYDIVSMTYVNAQWNFDKQSRLNPYLAAQYFGENGSGQQLTGTIHNSTFGGQFGTALTHDLSFALSFDGSPLSRYIVPAKNCKGTVSSPQSAAPAGIFGGVADTSASGLPAGKVLCYGGGVASPYTDNYATDPLYTTQISQGLADVHKPGTGAKAAMTWLSGNRRIKAIVSDAWYNYGLPGSSGAMSNADARSEFNVDVQYFFNPVRSGPYKGLSIRQRYADRIQPFSPYDFKYSRTQLEYVF